MPVAANARVNMVICTLVPLVYNGEVWFALKLSQFHGEPHVP
jgi:hypothetical protein